MGARRGFFSWLRSLGQQERFHRRPDAACDAPLPGGRSVADTDARLTGGARCGAARRLLAARWVVCAALLLTVVAQFVPVDAEAQILTTKKAYDFWLECPFTSVTEGEDDVTPTLHWQWRTVSVTNSDTHWPGREPGFRLYTRPEGLTTMPDDGRLLPRPGTSVKGYRIPFSLLEDSIAEPAQDLRVYVTPIDRAWDADDPERDMKCTVKLYDNDPPQLVSANITSSPLRGDTYGVGETIELTIKFDHPVTPSVGSRLYLQFEGNSFRQLDIVAGQPSKQVVGRYTVVSTDLDTDGLSVHPSSLYVQTYDNVKLHHYRIGGQESIPDLPGHKVDGRIDNRIPDPPTDLTATATRSHFNVSWSAPAWRGASPIDYYQLQQYNAGRTSFLFYYPDASERQQSYRHNLSAGETRYFTMWARNSYGRSAASTVVQATVPPGVTSVSVTSRPAAGGFGDTYYRGEDIWVEVEFDRLMAVTGTPELSLAFGDDERSALYREKTDPAGTNTTRLRFRYTVAEGDLASNGISIRASDAAGTVGLVGGDIKDRITSVEASRAYAGRSNLPLHKVNGNRSPHPGVSTNLTATATRSHFNLNWSAPTWTGSTPITGYKIEYSEDAGVTWKELVDDTGSSSSSYGHDHDGKAGGTTWHFRVSAINAQGTGGRSNVNSATVPPGVSAVSITSTPAQGDTYGRDETVEVQVTFDREVTVSETPRVVLEMGTAFKFADYASGSGTDVLTFRYRVQETDSDSNGLSVISDSSGTGSITDRENGLAADPTFSNISDSPGHKVNGNNVFVPLWQLSLSSDTVREDDAEGVTATVSITNGFTFDTAQNVNLKWGDQNLVDAGLQKLGGQVFVRIPKNQSSGSRTLLPRNKETYRPPETRPIIARHDGTEIGRQDLTRIDDEAPPAVSISASNDSVSEGQPITLTVNLTGAPSVVDVPVAITISDPDGAVSGELPSPLTIEAGQDQATFSIATADDDVVQGNRTVTFKVTGNPDYPSDFHYSPGTPSSATVTITDDTLAWTVTAKAGIAEASGVANLTMSTGGPTFPEDQTITLDLTGSTATAGADFRLYDAEGEILNAPYSLTLSAGASKATGTLGAISDIIVEGSEYASIKAKHDGVQIGTTKTVVIADDDHPTWSVELVPSSILEAGGASTLLVSTGGVVYVDEQTIALDLTGSTATAGSDFTLADGDGTTLTAPYSLTLAADSSGATATLTAQDDDLDEDDELVTIAASRDDEAIGTTQTLTIRDNDTAGVRVEPTRVTVTEGGAAATYTMVLTSLPGSEVTVTPAVTQGSDDVTVNPQTLTFTVSNWNEAQTVTVTPVDDNIDEDMETAQVSHTVSGYGSVTTAAGVDVEVSDNDSAPTAVQLSVSPSTVTEGGGAQTVTVTASLVDTARSVATAVTVSVSDDTATAPDDFATVEDLTLTIPAESKSVTGTFTLTPVNDSVAEGAETVRVSVTAEGLTAGTADLTIDDDDTAGVTISPTTLTVPEGDATGVDYTVVLTSKPAGDVTVAISGHASTDVSIASVGLSNDNKLTFTTANWGTAQTVTVKAAEDDDGVTDADVSLAHAISSNDDTDYDALADQTVTVSITENDTVGVTISPTTLTVPEGDATGVDYTVVLTSKPAGNVTVTVSGHANTDVSIASAGLSNDNKLTFTTATWDTAQTVTVKAAEDDDGVTDADVALAHAISSTDDTDYDALTAQTVTVSITENDTVGVTISPTDLTVVEGDATGVDYTVVLTSKPAGDVTVTVSGHANTDLTLSGETLTNNVVTFTTATWNTAQTVTVKAAEDDDGVTDADVSLAHAISSDDDTDYDALADQTVTVSITENDAVGVTISPTDLTVVEGNATGVDYTVVLTSKPAGDVTVTVSGHANTDLTLSGETLTNNVLTFTTATWDTAQTVTVKVAEDDDGVTDADVSLAHAISSDDDTDYDALAAQTVTVSITENDAVGVTISPTDLTVVEGDATGVDYTVVLTSKPAGDVTVAISGHASTDLTLSGTGLSNDNKLTFTIANWNTAQTVTVKAAEDDDGVTDADITVTHAISSDDDTDYDALADQTVTVSITENDTVGVTISPTDLTVPEGNATGVDYTVVLTSKPSGDVIVAISGHAGSDLTLSGTGLSNDNKLTFTTATWATAQTVTVKAAEDDDGVTDADVSLAHAISSTDDTDYDALADQTVTVSITENDAVGVTISPTTLTVTEGDATGVDYTVVLTSKPAGDVIVAISGHAGSDLTLSGTGLSNDNKLTFTTTTWGTAQTVTVKAAEDDDGVTDTDVSLAHAISSDNDTDYDALAAQTVTVSITENDTVGVTISPTDLTVPEGNATGVDYTVVLTSKPSGDVTVAISGHAGSDLTLSGTGLSNDNKLTFTTANWATAQTVTVKAAEDDDGVTDADVSLAHAISSDDDTDYDALAAQTVTVSITENDVVGVTIGPTDLTVTEGDATGVDYSVVLTSKPAGDVTVAISGHAGSDLTLSGTGLSNDNKLTFTTATWGTAQSVTVKAAEDDDGVTDADVSLAHAISSDDDTDYDAVAAQTVTVSITENDTVGVTISPTDLTVPEGAATGVDYTVVLTSKPSGDVTVAISGHAGSDLTLSGTGLSNDNKLTFTTANWATAQTVTVKAAEDDDGVTDADVSLAHAISSTDDTDYDALADQTVTVSITENDAVGVTISPTTLTVTEGDATGVDYTVVLTSKPAGDVIVAISGHANTDVSIASAGLSNDNKLTFTTANWATAQTVTVKVAEDDDGVTDADVSLAHAISSDDDTDYDALAAQTVTVSITENDAVGVTISPTDLTVVEGDATGVDYTVVLTSKPAGDVTVAISGHASTDLTLSGTGLSNDNKLTFTIANWNTAQTVTVKAAEDDDGVTDADITVTHAISSDDDTDYDALADQTVTVSITENDTVGVTISPTDLTVPEGNATGVDYTVVLTSKPSGDVIVAISGHAGSDLTLSGTGLSNDNKLTFTTATWATAQTVTVKAAEDDDGVTDADVSLAHAISSTDDTDYDALADQTVTVSITENDAVGVTISPTTLTVTEGDATGVDYTVVLTSKPAGDVIVAISGHAGSDLTLSGTGLSNDNKLTFTTTTWGTAQTVTVKAAEDDDGVTDTDVSLAHAISSDDDTDYDALADQTVTVSITENDTVGVTISPTDLTVPEGNATGVDYTVVLTSKPAGDVTVAISGHASTDVSIASVGLSNDNKLTFTTANWATAQTVTVKAAEDDDGVTDADVSLAHAISSDDDTDYDALADQTVTVSITENDAVGVTISPTDLTVVEGNATGVDYTVVLTSKPAGDVTVTVSGHANTDLTLSGETLTNNVLTFTTATWDTAQTVTVKVAEDDDGVTDADVSLAHAISSDDDTDYDALAAQTVTVSITENDAVGVTISPTDLTVVEGDATGVDYTVVLTSKPAGDVTVAISGHASTDLTLSGTGLSNDNKLTFTTATWATAQTVTVKAAEDDDGVTDADVSLAHAISSDDDTDYDALAAQTVTVSITENDAVGVTISPTDLTVVEGDATGVDYTVVLTSKPAGDVTVAISGHASTDLTLSGTGLSNDNKLTFTTANWNTAQTVTVKAAEDDDGVTDADITVTHAISSDDDTDYDALADQTVTVSITENDTVGVTISPTDLTVPEGNATGVDYTVVLTSKPSGDVIVAISGHAGSDLTLSGTGLSNDNKLTFTTATWATAQTVTVKAAEDDDGVTDADVSLAHAISSTDDTDYDALADQTVTVSITENDAVGVTISPTTLTVTEGDATGVDYSVVLTSKPAGDVIVAISGHAGSDLTLSGTGLSNDNKLTFTTTTWGTAQTVTVKAAEDDDGVTDTDVSLAHAISSDDDTDYDALAAQTVTVSITENDTVGVTISPTDLTVPEGDATGVDYTVVLTSKPSGDVTVAISGHAGSDLTLSGTGLSNDNKLTFTTANWATAQTVTVKAAEDDDGVTDAAVSLAHAISSDDDTDYDALAAQTVTVSITENDVVGVTIGPTDLTVTEGDATGVDYTVVLTSKPAGDVTVAISGHAGSDLTLSGTGLSNDNKLTFTTATWGTAQTVTVKAAEDDDGVTDADVSLAHAISSDDDTDYDALAAQTVTVSITENDAVSVTISPTDLTVVEGDATGVDYTVVLTSKPAGDVTVAISGHASTDLTLSGTGLSNDNKLSFTTATWGTAQTVTVKAAEDDDGVTDADVALAHAISSTDDTDYDALTAQTVTVSITENDTVGVTISPTDLTVVEGDATGVDYTVVLTSKPAGDVTVTVSGHANTDLTLSGETLTNNVLTFTTATWNTAQTVTVKAAEDDDGVTDADVALAHAISSTDDTDYDALADQTVTVSITENDTIGVTISPKTLTVTEGDATGVDYTVVLTSQPAGDVTVTVSGHANTDVSIASAGLSNDNKLTFTTANWSTAQTVTVKASEDDDGVTDADVSVAHAISSDDDTDYDALAAQTMTVSITENDVVGVTISPTDLTVTEGDAIGVDYTVVLTSKPAGTVTVAISGHASTDLTLSGTGLSNDNKLTFTTATWGTAQTVTVKAAEDDDGVTDADVALAHAISSDDDKDYDALADQTVTVSITENDVVGVTISPTDLTVVEGNATGVDYTVVLTSKPAGDVTVTISGHANTDVSIASAGLSNDNKLTFTTATWATAQTVTVKAAEDDDGVTDADVSLAHAISSDDDTDYDALAAQTVTVSITENDAVGVTISPTDLTVVEGNATGVDYTVVLTSKPAGDVTVAISGHANTDVSIASAGLSNDNKLTFTTATWDTGQTVTVKAAEDDDGVTDADITLTHDISSTDDTDYDALAAQTVTVSITENDAVGVTISPTDLTVVEGNATGVDYTVVLTSKPAGDVTVTISGHANTDASIASAGLSNDNKLTFTTATWATAQTVTVKAAEDDDGVTDADVSLAHAISSDDDTDYDALAAQTVTVSITENDAVGVTISPTDLTVVEGNATGVDYTVVLTSKPAGDVTVAISGHANTDVSIASAGLSNDNKLTFTTATWDTGQTVTVKAAEDDDGVTDADITLTHDISSTDDTDYDALADQTVTVSITENDIVGVTISPTDLTVVEGNATGVDYTVVLTSKPAGDVTVAISGHANTDVSIASAGLSNDNKLTFTTATWDTGQTVTVKAAEDDDGVTDADITLTHDISSTDDTDYDALADQTVTVSITENDIVGVTISPTDLTVVEGNATGVDYTVVLTSKPAGDVTVAISGHANTDVSIASAGLSNDNKLTFTTATWGTAQTVTVKAAGDDDAVTDADITLTHDISSTDDTDYDALADQTVTVSITENDAVGVTISPTDLTVVEGNATGVDYTVVLTSKPAGDVTVAISGHANTDVSITSPGLSNDGKLTFTTATWGTAQTVTVKAADDDGGVTDTDVSLAHAISSADDTDYDALADQTVTVSITENDTVGVTISPTDLTVTEGDATGVDYTVVLTSKPAGDVTVAISGHANTEVSIASAGLSNDGKLTFTTASWGTAQTVTVKAAADDDGVTDADITLTHDISSTDDTDYDALADQTVTVSITENDTVGVTISPTDLTVVEGNATGVDYTVVLTSKPAGDVTVAISGHANTDVSIASAGLSNDNKLTFTTATWDTGQTVTVKAAEDDDGVTDADITLTHDISSADDTDYDALADQTVTVSITENDVVGVTISPTDLTVVEGNATGVDYTVVLTSKPAGDVTVAISGHANTEVSIASAGLSNDGKLTFTTASWGTAQTVTVKAAADDDAVTDADITLTHDISSTDDTDYDALADQTVTVSITENDIVGVTISPTDLTVTEGNATGVDYTVVLTSKPAGDVTVAISGHANTEVSIASAGLSNDGKLTFTTATWGTAQTVTVKAAEDDDGVTDADITLTHDISSADDTDYDALADQTVTVSITENDVVGVTISPTDLTVVEGNATGVDYTVVLTSKPAGDVTVAISGHANTEVSIASAGLSNDGKLTFTTASWGTAQTVTVKAADDDDAVTDADITLTHAISSADDTDYDALADQTVTVSITENDTVGVTISPTDLTVTEGDATGVDYTVVLTSQPAGDVTVAISGHANTDVSIASPGLSNDNKLTFTTATWGTAQTVTVKAAEDDDTADDSATITHTVSGADYTDVTAADVNVKVIDNDDAEMEVSFERETYSVPEGSSVTVMVQLNGDPGHEMIVPLTTVNQGGVDNGDYSGVPGSVTFQNGDTEQYISFNAVQDNVDENGESVMLGFGPMPDGVIAGDTDETTVTIIDNEPLGTNGRPGAPRSTTLSSGDGKVVMQWFPPSLTGASPIRHYEYRLDAEYLGNPWIEIPDSAPGEPNQGRYEIAYPNGSYATVYLRAVNDHGAGLDVHRSAVPFAGAPGPPTNFSATLISENEFRLSWTEPVAAPGVIITGYSIDGSPDGVTDWEQSTYNITVPGTTSLTGRIGPRRGAFRIATRFQVETPAVIDGFEFSEGRSEASPVSPVVRPRNRETSVDPALPQIRVWDAFAREGHDAAVNFTVRLLPAATSTVTVDYRTEDIRATAPDDYEATSGTLTFAPGETEKTVSVPVVDDAVEDSGEEFALLLSNVSGARLGDEGAAGAIFNEEDVLGGFTLVDAASGTDVGAIEHGATMTLDDPATGSFGIVARAASDVPIGSVRLELSGAKAVARTDNAAPYTLYTGGGAALPAGGYTLSATAYAEANGGGKALQTRTVSFTVRGPAVDDENDGAAAATALTASFGAMPSEHAGPGARFVFQLTFSEEPKVGYKKLRDHAFSVTGGNVREAQRRQQGSNVGWNITVEPSEWSDIAISLPGGRACTSSGGICTADDRRLSNSPNAAVQGPAALSVADARAREGTDATLDFTVSLSRASSQTVTVDYATSDGTATAGADYTATSGTLTFVPGDVSETVSVPVLDDAHDDDGETLTLTLSNASGARIRDGEATGTIENSDAIPKAWLARFGRTVADNVVDAVATRLEGSPGGGSQVTLGGQRIPLDDVLSGTSPGATAGGDARETAAADTLEAFADWISDDGAGAGWINWGGPGGEDAATGPASRTLGGRELVLGSAFRLSAGGDGEGDGGVGTRWTAWGRAAQSSFDGDADGLALDGDVSTFMLGADAEWTRWLAGAAVSLSDGEGGFRDREARAGDGSRSSGTLESTMTSVHPYARFEMSERLSVWGILGYGTGELTLEVDGAGRWRTDTEMRMAASGVSGKIVSAEDTGGFELAARGDARLVRVSSAAATGADGAGLLSATEAETSRLRFMLTGSHRFELADGRTLTPSLELGLRNDSGDAETGTGIELGGGVRYSDPGAGLTVEAKARGLVAHEDTDYSEWGASGSVRIDPGASGRGLSLTLTPAWGAASGGAERLWSARDARGLATNDAFEPVGRLDAEAGWGVRAGGGVATPFAGLGLSDAGDRTWRSGVRWTLGPDMAFGVEGTLREAGNDNAAEHGLMLRAGMSW